MEFDAGAAIGAGLIGGAVTSMLLYMGIGMMHAVMSIAFGLVHVAFFVAFGLESSLVAWGILFGVVHWMISGMGLGMLPMMHPLIRAGEMDRPGAFALSYPSMTAMGFFMLHIVFGVLTGAFYTVFT